MKLTKKQIQQIQESLMIKPRLKKELLAKWDRLDLEQQRAILKMLGIVKEFQDDLIHAAVHENPNFNSDLKHFVVAKKSQIRSQVEAEDQQIDVARVDDILSEIDKEPSPNKH